MACWSSRFLDVAMLLYSRPGSGRLDSFLGSDLDRHGLVRFRPRKFMHIFWLGEFADVGLTRRELCCLRETGSSSSQFCCCQCRVVCCCGCSVHLYLDHSFISEINQVRHTLSACLPIVVFSIRQI